jgi:hypothetical protein
MDECYFSFKIGNVYIKFSKTRQFKIVYLDKEEQWREKVIFSL